MNSKNLNIIVYNANYYGIMAPSQRIRNLFEPLSLREDVIINNLVFNDEDLPKKGAIYKVGFKNFTYNFQNPFSLLLFFSNSFIYLIKHKKRSQTNIFYCYDFPSIENIFILVIAKLLNYKIAFDIVEDLDLLIDLKSKSKKIKLYIFSVIKMQKLIFVLGNVCFAISNHLVKKYITLSNCKIPIIYLPISAQITEIQKFINKRHIKETTTIFYGGSFGPKDGLLFLIEGFELACTKAANIELVLTGKGNLIDEQNIENRIALSSFKDRMYYLKCLSKVDYFKTMSSADILCMVRENTPYANAGFPFKLGEYLSSGNAVIATRVGDIPYYLENNKNALIIEPENPTEICDAIIKLSNNYELRMKLGNEGLKVAQKNFDANIVSEKLYSILIVL
jgi:glycosyltransferase involved in cell wall biosynthesis